MGYGGRAAGLGARVGRGIANIGGKIRNAGRAAMSAFKPKFKMPVKMFSPQTARASIAERAARIPLGPPGVQVPLPYPPVNSLAPFRGTPHNVMRGALNFMRGTPNFMSKAVGGVRGAGSRVWNQAKRIGSMKVPKEVSVPLIVGGGGGAIAGPLIHMDQALEQYGDAVDRSNQLNQAPNVRGTPNVMRPPQVVDLWDSRGRPNIKEVPNIKKPPQPDMFSRGLDKLKREYNRYKQYRQRRLSENAPLRHAIPDINPNQPIPPGIRERMQSDEFRRGMDELRERHEQGLSEDERRALRRRRYEEEQDRRDRQLMREYMGQQRLGLVPWGKGVTTVDEVRNFLLDAYGRNMLRGAMGPFGLHILPYDMEKNKEMSRPIY